MKIKLFRAKKVYVRICRLSIISWQGFQDVVRTLENEEISKIDIRVVRELLESSD